MEFAAPHLTYNRNDWLLSLILDEIGRRPRKVRDSISPARLADTIISKMIPQYADLMLKSLKSNLPRILEKRRSYERQFEDRLLQRWKKPLDLLEVLIEISLEAGAELNSEYGATAAKSRDYMLYVLTRLQARGCQVSHEILCLLKAGLADGAHARWRTLHEIAVIAYFIKNGGQEIAKRYFHYGIIETYRESLHYQKHCHALGYEPPTEEEQHGIQTMYDEVVKMYGGDFRDKYGWIPKHVLKNRTFDELEKSVHMDKLRPYYMMACHNVHSGPKGIQFRLGLLKRGPRGSVILAGPSNYGLADPGQGTAISLSQTTSCLLSMRPTIERLSMMNVILKLVEEINQAFCEVQRQIEKEVLEDEGKSFRVGL
jgi:hypothetical protein